MSLIFDFAIKFLNSNNVFIMNFKQKIYFFSQTKTNSDQSM